MTHIKTTTSPQIRASHDWKAFAETVRRERRTRGLTQSQAATAAGMGTAQAWSWYERGKSARRSTVETLERALGITDGRLLVASGFMEASTKRDVSTTSADDMDSLTRLGNLQGFYKRRDEEFSRVNDEWRMSSDSPSPLSLVMFEIGSFNALISNRYGPRVAEAVIQEIARILRRRAQGRFVARMVFPQQQPFDFDHRYERDFGVILPDTSREEAEAFAMDCKKRIQEHNWTEIVMSVQNSTSLSDRYMKADPGEVIVAIPFGLATYEERNGSMTADNPDDLFQQVLVNLDEHKYRVLVGQVIEQVRSQVESLLPSELKENFPLWETEQSEGEVTDKHKRVAIKIAKAVSEKIAVDSRRGKPTRATPVRSSDFDGFDNPQ